MLMAMDIQGACSHYALNGEPEQYTLQCVVKLPGSCPLLLTLAEPLLDSSQSARSLLKSIQRNFGTVPFCRRYLDRAGEKNYLLAVRLLPPIPREVVLTVCADSSTRSSRRTSCRRTRHSSTRSRGESR